MALLALALLAAALLPGRWAAAAFVLSAGAMPAVFLFVAARRAGARWPAAAVAVTALSVAGGFAFLLATRHLDPLARWLGGLPLALGVLVWAMAGAPLVLLGLAFGLGWRTWRPSDGALDELRRLAAAERGDG